MNKKKKMSTKFKVVNLVAVMNCGFMIKLSKVWKDKYCVKVLTDRFDKPYTYVMPKGCTKAVTIFYNGNMISLANKSSQEARKNLEAVKKYLVKFKLEDKLSKRGKK